MRRLVRTLALTGAAGALTLLTAPASQAAPSAASACVTATETQSYGRGEISLCPQSDGTTRVTGWVEDLLPGSWTAPDGACAGWWVQMGEKNGTIGPMVCPHFSSTHKTVNNFDYTVKFDAPVTGAKLGAFRM
ncbi:hypothetical protein [Streptomyces sp. NPDC046261]|uniref:hypothetical protein n=1 Tax=Streptomyces sp. NPDC046261 TaxID=3157200 RepID=UPI0034086B1F